MTVSLSVRPLRTAATRVTLALAAAAGPSMLLAQGAVASASASASASALTPADLLDVRTVSAGDYSPDGKWLVVRIARRGDGLGFVAARDGDPSYTRPAPARLLLLNTATGDTTAILSTPRTIGTLAWSPQSERLAIATRDTIPQLLIWHVATRTLRTQSLAGARLAENSDLSWTDDGRLLMAVRERQWLNEVRARFDSLVGGPISVQVGTEPFLAWDMLRRLGNRAMVVALTPSSARLDTLIPAAQITSWNASPNGQRLSWREDRNAKTNYDGGPSNESRLLTRLGRDSARVVFASLRGVTLLQAADGDRYAFARDGAIYLASLTDTTPRKLIGPATSRVRVRGDSARGNDEERFALAGFSPSGEHVVASSRTGLHLIAVTDGARRPIGAVTDSIRGPRFTLADWSRDGRSLLVSMSSRTTWNRALIRVNLATNRIDTLVRDGRLYGAPKLSPDGARVAVMIGENGRPADLWLGDATTFVPKRLVESNPQFAARALPTTQLVEYLDADGRAQFGVLTMPAGGGRGLPDLRPARA